MLVRICGITYEIVSEVGFEVEINEDEIRGFFMGMKAMIDYDDIENKKTTEAQMRNFIVDLVEESFNYSISLYEVKNQRIIAEF